MFRGAGWKKRHLVKFGRADRMVETHADHVGPRGRETQSYTRALSTIYFPPSPSAKGGKHACVERDEQAKGRLKLNDLVKRE